VKKSVQFAFFMIILGTSAFVPVVAQDDLVYVAVDPCRIVDTRNAGGVITANNFRNFKASGDAETIAAQGGNPAGCPNPKGETKPLAVTAYVIAVPPGSDSTSGVLSAYPAGQPVPPVGSGSTVNFDAQEIIGNTTTITLCDPAGACPDGDFAILARNTNQHVVVDVQGNFYPATGDAVASVGTVACSGNFRESTDTASRWTIHNLNDSASITLDRMRVYTAGGTNVYDSINDGPATSATVVPFGDIGPYQTLSFKSEDLITDGLLPAELPGNERPIKVIFDWSSTNSQRVLTPYVLLTRHSISGNGETRHARDCRSID